MSRLPFFLLPLFAGACTLTLSTADKTLTPSDDPTDADTDSDTDSDTDADTDADSDSDADTDSDTDSDTDADTDPTLDTDGDGLTDLTEGGLGTDPSNPDTDGDGLQDGTEVDHATDPLDTDTDGDGLDDGDENPNGADPLNPDTDGDGINDGKEVNFGTDPANVDTDGDGLQDGDEVTFGLDPLNADTDGGGVQDGDEVTAGTDPLDPLDDLASCAYAIAVGVDDPTFVPALPAFQPTWAATSFEILQDGGAIHDFSADLDASGGITGDEQFSARFVVELYGPEVDPICTVAFDADAATPIDPALLGAAGLLFGAWTIAPSSGQTDCPALDPALYGTDDIREVLANIDWAFGVGEMGALEPILAAAVGPTYTTDFAPYVAGAYVLVNGVIDASIPYGYAFGAEVGCDQVTLDGSGFLVNLPAPTAAPLETGYWSSSALFVHPLEEITGVGCQFPPDFDLTDPAYVPPTPRVTPTYFAIGLDALPDVYGASRDAFYDFDGDGTLAPDEVIPTNVTFTFYDAAVTELCSVTWDASAATPIDPTTLTTTGDLYQAWSLDLVDGLSDCNAIPNATFGTTDVRDLFAGLPFVFATGESLDSATQLLAQFPTTYATDYEPFVYGVYASFDGATADEVSYGFLYDVNDCSVVDPAVVTHPVEDAASGRIGLYEAYQMFLLTL